MKARKGIVALLASLLACASLPAPAQSAGKLFVRPLFEAYSPLDTYTNDVTGQTSKLYSSLGVSAGAALDYSLKEWLYPFLRVDYLNMPYSGGSSLSGSEAQLGLGLVYHPFDRVSIRLDAMGGMASLSTEKLSGSALSLGARTGLSYRLSPSFSLSASGGYSTLRGTADPILSAFSAGLSLSYDLSSLGGIKPMVAVEDPKLDAVFPSLYSYYDDNAFWTVRIVNREDAKIKDVRVSFNASRYMDQPKLCAEYPELARGESAVVPVKALFSDIVLQVTQGVDAKGEIIVDYSYLGSELHQRVPVDFRLHHRNAITWSDDRRAAAFVSPTNPASLWFSRFASGVVRDRIRGDINKPLQYAVGMFESERLYGLNYVVVPANDYSVKHGLKDYVDSVQFPHQTLQNRGGDCSDLAILFSSLMQSVGVDTAFITIPGHIFAAFDTGLTEEEARENFYDPGLLIYKDGHAWIPVEITMVKDGFNKAWSIGAKEWYDNVKRGDAAFYRVPDCWKVYPPAAFPGVNPRFTLPSEVDESLAFDTALDRYVAREMKPRIEALRTELADEKPETQANEVGILYAHYGLLKDSWKELSDSAKAGCPSAWTNLGNVAYIRKDFKLALSYYQWAIKQNSDDDNALLGIARCQYELEDFDASDSAYASLKVKAPALANKFGYLGSVFGGEGRAWSLADRFASTKWASALKPKPAPSPAEAPPIEVPAVADQAPSDATLPAVAEAPQAPVLALAPSAKESPAPVKAVEAPSISNELPTDSELAAAKAESEANKQAALTEAAEKAAIPPSAAPAVSSELPADAEAAAKRAEAAKEAPAVAAVPSVPPASEFVAPVVIPPAPAVEPAPVPSVEPAPAAETKAETPAPSVQEPAPAAPAASPAEPIRGPFDGAMAILGTWKIDGGKAVQSDGDCYFAKLAIPLVQSEDGIYRYSFVAKSTARGRGWVGVGAHLFAPESHSFVGYGWGDSLVVWLTRDPVHYQKDITRIQLYRSMNDNWMLPVAEAIVPESIFDENRFDVSFDPKAGTVSVSLNGTERLQVKDLPKLYEGRYVVLRTLDTAEFSAFRTEASK